MSLIKCPECGKEISDKAISCPQCGCPISCSKTVFIEETISPNTDETWTKKWKNKAIFRKLIATAIFFVILAAFLFVFYLSETDLEEVYYEYSGHTAYYSKTEYILPFYLLLYLTIVSLVFTLCFVIIKRVRIRKIDGYTVLLFYGLFHKTLVVENVIQERRIERYLYGKLPNNKSLTVSISWWDYSPKYEVSNTIIN